MRISDWSSDVCSSDLALRGLLSGCEVVGEEAVAADPALLDAARGGAVWPVDPIDGTSGFVDGSPDHAVMVALLDEGVTEASWVLQPAHEPLWDDRKSGVSGNRGSVRVNTGWRP